MSRPNVLLVDDNRLFLELEKDFLKQCAVMVYTAANGSEVFDLLKIVRPDLIFMDLHMPKMDGASCCAALKADKDLRSIPVVMLTIADLESDMERCRKAGCDGILTKPIDKEHFLEFGHKFLPNIDNIELRAPCRSQVVFRLNNNAHYGTSADLSMHGLFIAFTGEVMINDQVRFDFMLPESSDLIEGVGRVSWINNGTPLRKPSLPEGFGVEFVKIPAEAVHLIERYMEVAARNEPERRVEEAYFSTEIL